MKKRNVVSGRKKSERNDIENQRKADWAECCDSFNDERIASSIFLIPCGVPTTEHGTHNSGSARAQLEKSNSHGETIVEIKVRP